MPNWCKGYVIVTGKQKDIKNFCKLFIFEDEYKINETFFARSFIRMSFKDFEKEHLGKDTAEFNVDFAWSGHTCLIEGYPDEKKCVTLEWACDKYNVEVEIDTEEGGMCFEEKIIYTKENGLREECNDMPTYICDCGNKMCFPSNCDDLDDEECDECGKIDSFKLLEKKNE